MKTLLPATILALLATGPMAFGENGCEASIERITAVAGRAKVDPIELLRMVDVEVTGNPGCCCEIVKAAIQGTECDDAIVGYVVETAIQAAPDQMRLIAQCAIATAPGSLGRVQEVMARLDPGAGESADSAKSAKSAKDAKGVEVKPQAAPADPLDLPPMPPPIPPLAPPPYPRPPSTQTDFYRF
ncbi:hypothetical protein HNR46_003343 [Haloferula luteola]|uniref:Uncharacterized protein n=1 Tax=Haloferula luteola TaxID=595692 RepID=A0A840VGY1_9BACT|nr:hypothetical protein [Haloferula luteola]MBB5353090.1 hypothetical protein [Haloferula luteola]